MNETSRQKEMPLFFLFPFNTSAHVHCWYIFIFGGWARDVKWWRWKYFGLLLTMCAGMVLANVIHNNNIPFSRRVYSFKKYRYKTKIVCNIMCGVQQQDIRRGRGKKLCNVWRVVTWKINEFQKGWQLDDTYRWSQYPNTPKRIMHSRSKWNRAKKK